MRRGPLTGTLSLLSCLKHLSNASLTPLHSGFQNCFILDPFCSNALIIWDLFSYGLYNFWDLIPDTYQLFFSVCHIGLFFLWILKTFLLFVTIAMLSHYQSPVNCRSINIKGNFRHKVKYHYYCHFPGHEFM